MNALRRRVERAIVDAFFRLYYGRHAQTWTATRWLGTQILKNPLDLWVYQEILFETRPDLIVETGTWSGGSAHYLASLCDLLGHGEVLTVDVEDRPGRPAHPRLTYLVGSSTAADVVARVRARAAGKARVMVVLDSDHRAEHVARELAAYHDLVTPGCYLIVEDTCVNGHPVLPAFGPGPMEAVEAFLATHGGFEVDAGREKFMMTFNPRGFLRRAGA